MSDVKAYLTLRTQPHHPHPVGTVVYRFNGHDYGCSSEDTRRLGFEHRAYTLNRDGSGPFFTHPVSGLAACQDDPGPRSDVAASMWRAGLEAAAQFLLSCDDYGDRAKADQIRAIQPALSRDAAVPASGGVETGGVVTITTNGTTRTIPADEPVFLIRGQDTVGGDAVRAWAELAWNAGAGLDVVNCAREHAEHMDRWPKKKVADLPKQEGEL